MVKDQHPHQVQLEGWKREHPDPEQATLLNGAPICDRFATLSVGPNGPLLMQDFRFFEEIAKFNRERVPERVVHAKGGGAHGYFEVTNSEITKYCKAELFNRVGKKTPVFIRFSTVAGEYGSADTVRDPRGFAVKFYTEEGNWDLVGNNTPVFFIRDAVLFPHFIHTQKRNPVTGLKDPNMAFDFFTLRPETTHQVMILYSDRGTPDGWRFMHGYGGHTFKLVNKDGQPVYCKFHLLTKVIKNLPTEYANKMQADDPDYAIRDLYDAIERGEYPEWKFCIQVMTFKQAEKYEFNPFDITKVWSHKQYPLIEVGKIVLNRNPKNYFQEVEQVAFCPARIVPGIEFSPDRMLQGRIFSYHDTQQHRIGTNYMQLPINCPYRARPHNYQRDGYMNSDNQGGTPVYVSNSYNGPVEREDVKETVWKASGDVGRYNSDDDDNFTQPSILWKNVFNDSQRQCLVQNLASDLCKCKPEIQKRAVDMFSKVHEDLGLNLQCALKQMGL